ncbi:MAG TPA: linear amide C-N hydrolase [Victivallales bacterium]|nr:linear amide C-N hydrolase [Victivallales bacterium]
MKKITTWAFGFIISLAAITTLQATSTFFLNTKNERVLGFNMDTPFNSYQDNIFVNVKDQKKTAYMPWENKPLHWVSKYNSVTQSPFSINFPLTGMNEKGLCIGETTLRETEYPKKDSRPAIGTFQWIQYQLDTAATVKEVIQSISKVRIAQNGFANMFIVADKEGNSAVIEFIKGKPIIFTGKTLPIPVITNREYGSSLKQLIDFELKSRKENLAENLINLYKIEYPYSVGYTRFIIATNLIKEYQTGKINEPIKNYTFFALSLIMQSSSKWSIIYNPVKMSISYKFRHNPEIRTFHFNDFKFSQNQMIYMDHKFKNINEITKDFTVSRNNEIIAKMAPQLKQVYKGLFTKTKQIEKNPMEAFNTFTKGLPEYIKNEYAKNNK